MDITEIRDALTQLIDQGHGKQKLWDSENLTFALAKIVLEQSLMADKDPDVFIKLEFDEVK